jgi:hypothetical protein
MSLMTGSTSTEQFLMSSPYKRTEWKCEYCEVYPVSSSDCGSSVCVLCSKVVPQYESLGWEQLGQLSRYLERLYKLPESKKWELVRADRVTRCKTHEVPWTIGQDNESCETCDKWWTSQLAIEDSCYGPNEWVCTDCGVYPVSDSSMGSTNCHLCFNNVEWYDPPEPEDESEAPLYYFLQRIKVLPFDKKEELVRKDRASRCADHRYVPCIHGCESCELWFAEQKKIADSCPKFKELVYFDF